MHRALLAESDPKIAGKWRTDQVWIGGGDFGPHGAVYVAPGPARLGPAVADLVQFMARDGDIPVLAHAAIAHAQFETIHPFPEGNGRTGRALIHSLLKAKGLVRRVLIPISAGLLADTPTYFAALDAYRLGDVDSIVSRIAEATFRSVVSGRRLVSDIITVRQTWSEQITARRDSAVWKIADLLVRHPAVDTSLLEAELKISGTNVRAALKTLEEAGVLVSYQVTKGRRAWRAPEILDCLDEFAARSGRRGFARSPVPL